MASLWYLFAVLFSLGSLGSFCFLLLIPLLEFNDSVNWIRTPCAVVRADVVESSASRNSQHNTRMFSPVIEFSYVFHGKSYISDRVTLTGFRSYATSDKKEAADYLKPYTENASRACLVNPKNPAIAILDNGFPIWNIILGGGMAALLFGCGFLFFFLARCWNNIVSSPKTQMDVQNLIPTGKEE
ncbi:MAG: DUF3592 domain-containing protein [Candidatus Ozemobacteraceae bacterium]